MPETALNADEENAFLCVDRMRPELQTIINRRFKGEALICAMTTAFAELLRERGGGDEPLTRAMEAFAQLPAPMREQARACHTQIKALITAVKEEGFTLDAILWSTLGAITSVYRGMRYPKRQIEAATGDMIERINEARRLTINRSLSYFPPASVIFGDSRVRNATIDKICYQEYELAEALTRNGNRSRKLPHQQRLRPFQP